MMMPDPFSVSAYHELLALQRVFREAKFCLSPSDDEISSSPIVSNLFRKLMDALIDADVARSGADARTRWAQWLAIDEGREEWAVAIGRAANHPGWSSWTTAERIGYANELLCPFTCTAEQLDRFVESVELRWSDIRHAQ